MEIEKGIRHTFIQVFLDMSAPLLQDVTTALPGRALAIGSTSEQ